MGSCAEVWSVTTSGRTPRRTSSGKMSAALPSRPTDSGFFSAHERSIIASASSSDLAWASRYLVLQPHLDAARLAFHRQHGGARHHRGQRLRAAHAAEAGGEDPLAREAAAVVAPAHLDEGLVGALHDALAADVDPRARRHLPEHHQALAVELVEVLERGPVRHDVGVGDQHARRVGVRAEDADRLARLHQQRLVGLQRAQRGDDAVEALPVARGPADAAVDDQLRRPLRHLRIEVVHEHAQRRFGEPALGGELGAARRADDAGVVDAGHVDLSSNASLASTAH